MKKLLLALLFVTVPVTAQADGELECNSVGIGYPIDETHHYSVFGLTPGEAKTFADDPDWVIMELGNVAEMYNPDVCEFCPYDGRCESEYEIVGLVRMRGIVTYDPETDAWMAGIQLDGDNMESQLSCSACY